MYSTEITDIDVQLTKYVYERSDLYIQYYWNYAMNWTAYGFWPNYTKLCMYLYKALIKYSLRPRAHKVVFERFHSELFEKAPNLLTLFTENQHEPRLRTKNNESVYSSYRFHFGCSENARKRPRVPWSSSMVFCTGGFLWAVARTKRVFERLVSFIHKAYHLQIVKNCKFKQAFYTGMYTSPFLHAQIHVRLACRFYIQEQ